MSEEESNPDIPDAPASDLAEAPNRAEDEPDHPDESDQDPNALSIEQRLAALESHIQALLVKDTQDQMRTDRAAAGQHAEDAESKTSNEHLNRELAELKDRVDGLAGVPSSTHDQPFPSVFIARQGGTDKQWQERTVTAGVTEDFTGGRKCEHDNTPDALIGLASDEFPVLEMSDIKAGVKVSAYLKLGTPATTQRFVIISLLSSTPVGRIALCKTWDGLNQGTEEIAVWVTAHNAVGDTLLAIRATPNFGTNYSPGKIYTASVLGVIHWVEVMDGAIYEMVVSTAGYPVCKAMSYDSHTGNLGTPVGVRTFHNAQFGEIIHAVPVVNGYSQSDESDLTYGFIEIPSEKSEGTLDLTPTPGAADARTWERTVDGVPFKTWWDRADDVTGTVMRRPVIFDQHGKLAYMGPETESPASSSGNPYPSTPTHQTSNAPRLTSTPPRTTSTGSGYALTSLPPHKTSVGGQHTTDGPAHSSGSPASSAPHTSSTPPGTGCPTLCAICFSTYHVEYHSPAGWDTSEDGVHDVALDTSCFWDSLGDGRDLIVSIYCEGGQWVGYLNRAAFDIINPEQYFYAPDTGGEGDCPALHSFTSPDGGSLHIT